MKRLIGFIGEVSLLVFLSVFLNNCGSSSGNNNGVSLSSTNGINAILFSSPTGSMPDNFQNAMVTVNDEFGRNITNAIVTMNSVTLSYNVSHQQYEGIVILAAQENPTVNVTFGGNIFTASDTQFTTYPHLTAPKSGDTWAANSNNNIKWSEPLANAVDVVGVLDATDPNGTLIWPFDNSLAVINMMAPSDVSQFLQSYSLSAGNRIAFVAQVRSIPIPNAPPGSSFTFGKFTYALFTVN